MFLICLYLLLVIFSLVIDWKSELSAGDVCRGHLWEAGRWEAAGRRDRAKRLGPRLRVAWRLRKISFKRLLKVFFFS